MTDGTVKWAKGDIVSLAREGGKYTFIEIHPKGWATLYGGDRAPEGRRQFRAVDPERIRPYKRQKWEGEER